MFKCTNNHVINILNIISYFPFSAFGKLHFHKSVQSTFEEAKDTCQKEGKELFRDIGYLTGFGKWVMSSESINSAWIGKQLLPFKYGMIYEAIKPSMP